MLILEPLERVRGACKHSHQKLRRVSLLGLTGVMLRRYGGIPGGIPRVSYAITPTLSRHVAPLPQLCIQSATCQHIEAGRTTPQPPQGIVSFTPYMRHVDIGYEDSMAFCTSSINPFTRKFASSIGLYS